MLEIGKFLDGTNCNVRSLKKKIDNFLFRKRETCVEDPNDEHILARKTIAAIPDTLQTKQVELQSISSIPMLLHRLLPQPEPQLFNNKDNIKLQYSFVQKICIWGCGKNCSLGLGNDKECNVCISYYLTYSQKYILSM